jgi:hypothetical protein
MAIPNPGITGWATSNLATNITLSPGQKLLDANANVNFLGYHQHVWPVTFRAKHGQFFRETYQVITTRQSTWKQIINVSAKFIVIIVQNPFCHSPQPGQ